MVLMISVPRYRNVLENWDPMTNILLNGLMTSLLNSLLPFHKLSYTNQTIKLANLTKFILMPSITAYCLKTYIHVFLKCLIFLIGTCIIVLVMSHTLLFILIWVTFYLSGYLELWMGLSCYKILLHCLNYLWFQN